MFIFLFLVGIAITLFIASKINMSSVFEHNLASRLPIWIGALSFVIAAFFLIKYSIEVGWVSPAIRTIIGGIFGIVLFGFFALF